MINLLKRVVPVWALKMDEIVDSVHWLREKEEKRTCPIIIQLVKCQHRDGVWRLTKESEACKEVELRFTEDLTLADKQAREALQLQIQEARRTGEKAYFHSPLGFINGQQI